MQFSNLRFGHGLFDPLIVTFQGQTLNWSSTLHKAPHIQKKFVPTMQGTLRNRGPISSRDPGLSMAGQL